LSGAKKIAPLEKYSQLQHRLQGASRDSHGVSCAVSGFGLVRR
jgi:hypothetical protein